MQPPAAGSTLAPQRQLRALTGSARLLLIAALGGTTLLGINALRGTPPTLPAETAVQPAPPATPIPQPPAAAPALEAQAQALPNPEPQRTVASPTRTSSGSRREIAQLARIKTLMEHDPAAARRLIRAAQREFPAGLLVEEREGLDAIALFALGQHERARSSAERFIARYPQSALRPKLERLIDDARP